MKPHFSQTPLPESSPWNRIQTVLCASGCPEIHTFARWIGLSDSVLLSRIQNGKFGIGPQLANRINKQFPQFSVPWLLGRKRAVAPVTGPKEEWVDLPYYESLCAETPCEVLRIPSSLSGGATIAVRIKCVLNRSAPYRQGAVLLLRPEPNPRSGEIYWVTTSPFRTLCIIRDAGWTEKVYVIPLTACNLTQSILLPLEEINCYTAIDWSMSYNHEGK